MKRAVRSLNTEGPQRLVSHRDDPLLPLLRETENGAERALTLVNTQEREARQVVVEDLLAAAGLTYLGDRLALGEMLPGGDEQPAAPRFTVAPLEVKVLRASLRPVRRLDLAPYRSAEHDAGHRPEL